MHAAACAACEEYASSLGASLVGACASVGIEAKRSTGEMAAMYLRGYHDRGHRPIGSGR